MNLAVLRDRIRDYNNCTDPEASSSLYESLMFDLVSMSASAHPNANLLANEFIITAAHDKRRY